MKLKITVTLPSEEWLLWSLSSVVIVTGLLGSWIGSAGSLADESGMIV